jgi:hypothetical protein
LAAENRAGTSKSAQKQDKESISSSPTSQRPSQRFQPRSRSSSWENRVADSTKHLVHRHRKSGAATG